MKSTKTVEKTTEREQLKDCVTLWLHESKAGNKYLKGHTAEGNKVIGYFNSKKEKPEQPDIRIYLVDEEGNREEKSCLALWENVSEEKGTKYLTGTTNENEKVVGWYQDISENEKRPYINAYYQNNTK